MALICRACLRNVADSSSFHYIDTFDNSERDYTVPKSVLQVCIPEMDLYVSEHAGICDACLRMFESFYEFKNKCLATEDRIISYAERRKRHSTKKVNLGLMLDEDEVEKTVEKNGRHVPRAIDSKILAKLENNEEIDLISLGAINNNKNNKATLNDKKQKTLFKCTECTFVTTTQSQLEEHKCAPPCKFQCPHCDYSSSRKYRLNYHVNAKHTNLMLELEENNPKVGGYSAKPIKCHFCDFVSSNSVALHQHRLAEHGPPVQYCKFCSYSTKDKSNFRKHLFIHGDKPLKCKQCNYQCVSPYQMTRHSKRNHSGRSDDD